MTGTTASFFEAKEPTGLVVVVVFIYHTLMTQWLEGVQMPRVGKLLVTFAPKPLKAEHLFPSQLLYYLSALEL